MTQKVAKPCSQFALPLKAKDVGTVISGRFTAGRDGHMEAVSKRLSVSGVFSSKPEGKKR